MWAIAVKFLRGVCVATDPGQWNEAEWPPHPARLFMAMAAAHFETLDPIRESDNDKQCRGAIEWLETLPAPRVLATRAEKRTPVTVFVPVNDSTRADQLFAGQRSRQPRYFPTSVPHGDEVYFVWEGDIPTSSVLSGLEQTAFNVTRVGHSSSLVQVWIEKCFENKATSLLSDDRVQQWVPGPSTGTTQQQFRVVAESAGTLAAYESNYNLAAVEKFADLQVAVSEAKGKAKRALRMELTKDFPDGMPPSQPVPASMTTSYHVVNESPRSAHESCFDDEIMVLSMHDAPALSLESTLQVAGALRKKIHDAYPDRRSPEWLGGHDAAGRRTGKPHMAIVPLPFVGGRYADGHLLGVGLIFPRDVPMRDRAIELRRVFKRLPDEEQLIIEITLKNFRRLSSPAQPDCVVQLIREQRLSPPKTLRGHTWTATSTVWETVTPIVLDRFPKQDRNKNRSAWNEEVESIIASSCINIGLPEPVAVTVHHNAFTRGVPKARPGSGGFPTMAQRDGKPSRFQVHARIAFSEPVVGPVLLGAGRFVGYGFCRPNHAACSVFRRAQ